MDLFTTLGKIFEPEIMEEEKKRPTIKKSVGIVFGKMPKIFGASSLISQVKVVSGRENVFDGTVLRKLRELRTDVDSGVNYEVIDNHKAIYKKIN